MDMIGQSFSHFQILDRLGEGGMGVVYKARDTKLDRIVAVKFLPQYLSARETEQARFLQEAKAAAALSHPNICAIHSIEEKDGELFIVMDFIDGQTLRQKMASGQVPLKLALAIGAQIADGLGAAHELGIVHRDIKPENIMIRNDGLVQIMDFGLAKLRGVSRLTKEGSTLGTMGYMSPEQVQGHDVDARTDIFSLGVVLYELLTGELPFKGDHEAAVIYQIVNVDAPLASSTRPEVSPELDAVVAECLAKEPEERYQFAKEVSRQLKRFKGDSKLGLKDQLGPSRAPFGYPRVSAQNRFQEGSSVGARARLFWIAAGILLVAASLYYFTYLIDRGPKLNPDRTSHELETSVPPSGPIGLSSDGNWVAFPAMDSKGRWNVYFMNTSARDPQRVTNEEGLNEIMPDVSPDGSKIVFSTIDRLSESRVTVRIVSSQGGPSKTILDRGIYPKWRPDGNRIGYLLTPTASKSGKWEFWTVRPDGGDNRLEFVDTLGGNSFGYSWSPDGKAIAWLREFPEHIDEIFIHELESGNERQLTFDRAGINLLCWGANDVVLYSSKKGGNPNLWMVAAGGGQSIQVTTETGSETDVRISADSKKVVYVQEQTVGHVWLLPVDGTAPPQQVTFDNSDIRFPSLSPDRKRIAFQTLSHDRWTSWIMDRDGNNRRQLTSSDRDSFLPSWSLDGKWIAYNSGSVGDSSQVYIINAQTLQMPTLVGHGVWPRWIGDTILTVIRQLRSWVVSTNGREMGPLFEDSTLSYSILSNRFILFRDFHGDRLGWWIVSADHRNDSGRKWAKRLGAYTDGYLLALKDDVFMIRGRRELWKLRIPEGKWENTHIYIPSLGEFSTGDANSVGKETVYSDSRISAKLVMIKDPFK
jgi:eukaryotic-like serine/threonine-protein kinase